MSSRLRGSNSLPAVGVRQHVHRVRQNLNGQHFALSANGFAVGVRRDAAFDGAHGDFGRTPHAHRPVLALGAADEGGRQRQNAHLVNIARQAQVKGAVGGVAIRRHHERAAHAPPVHHRNHQEGLPQHAVVERDFINGRFGVLEDGADDRHQVGGAAVQPLHLGGFKTDHGVESQPHAVAKVAPIGVVTAGHPADVNAPALPAGERVAGRGQLVRDAHAEGEIVAAPDGQHAQRGAFAPVERRAHQPVDGFIDRAVAARHHQQVAASFHRLLAQPLRVPHAFGERQIVLKTALAEQRLNFGEQLAGVAFAGRRVVHKHGFNRHGLPLKIQFHSIKHANPPGGARGAGGEFLVA